MPQSGLGFGERFGMRDGAARSEARTRAGCAGGAGALIELEPYPAVTKPCMPGRHGVGASHW